MSVRERPSTRLLAPWDALSFLTRLAPPSPGLTEERLVAAVPWYPLAGLAVGVCGALPLVCIQLGTPSGDLAFAHAAILGWLYVLISLWATRGLHWDGLADVADAWGSGKSGPDFYRILKDSRIGAFGVMALVMGLTGQGLAAGIACNAGNWPALVFAPLAGRAAAVMLAAVCPAHPDSALGRLAVRGASLRLACLFGLGFIVCSVWLSGLVSAVLLTAAAAGILYTLRRLALREGGVGGDFFGAAIVLTETAALLTTF